MKAAFVILALLFYASADASTPKCTLYANPIGGAFELTATCNPVPTFYFVTGRNCTLQGPSFTSCFVYPDLEELTYTLTGANSDGIGNTTSVTIPSVADLPTPTSQTVIEFYNPDLDHYFVTANPAEVAKVDSGIEGRWIRTGSTFKAGGDSPVCRFYGSQSPGPNSHFYTVAASECSGLLEQQSTVPVTSKRWNFENFNFMSTSALYPAVSNNKDGYCPVGLMPIYRAYNDGFAKGIDSNHRITPDLSAIHEVVLRGWVSEGVVMCAPQ